MASKDILKWLSGLCSICYVLLVFWLATGRHRTRNIEGTVAEIGWQLPELRLSFDNRHWHAECDVFVDAL